jgi:hypothetical protein
MYVINLVVFPVGEAAPSYYMTASALVYRGLRRPTLLDDAS